MSSPGRGDPFHGDKRTDETVMIGSDDLSDLVAQAKGAAAAEPTPDQAAEPTPDQAAVQAFEAVAAPTAAQGSRTLLIVGAVVVVLALIGILLFAL